MRRYLEDLIRNRNFLRLIKKMRRTDKHRPSTGGYYTWTTEEQKYHDYVNRELSDIIGGYERLRRRCLRLYKKERHFKYKEIIAELFGLDLYLIALTEAKVSGDSKKLEHAELFADMYMCRIESTYEELHPFNRGEEIIYLNIRRQIARMAFPVAVYIHPRASKRDVLHFIEKRWPWIESELRSPDAPKALRVRARKHKQEVLDFIWLNRDLPAKEIKKRLDGVFPENGLVYYEFSKIIQQESKRRFGYLT